MPALDIIVIGGSAGGLDALIEILPRLPVPLPAAVFIVLHSSPDPGSRFPLVLSRKTGLRVSFATDLEPITRGRIYVAPPDHHLLVTPGRIRVTRGPRENRHRPAIDPLFRSAALAFGPRVIGVVLSGMLDDGTAGLWTIRDRKGTTVVQHPDDAIHSMMPRSAIENVPVDWQCSAREIGPLLARLIRMPVADQDERPMSEELAAELQIAAEEHPLKAGSLQLGPLTPYTCPDCQGVLSQVREGSVLRFRCHTGHAYSADSLLASLTDTIEASLWSVVRGLEERTLLLRHMATHLEEIGHRRQAEETRRLAREGEVQGERMREMVIEGMDGNHLPNRRVV
jgi:two-component system chemotaxis response regulator CheB